MREKTVNVRRTLVKQYNRFANKAMGNCLLLGALGVYLLMLMVESVFPSPKPMYENYKDRRDRLWFQLPLDVMRWCGLPEGVIRVVLVCGIIGCCGGILGIVFWVRRMKRAVPPAVKLRKVRE